MDIILLVGIIIYLIITAYTGYAAIEKLKGNELSEEKQIQRYRFSFLGMWFPGVLLCYLLLWDRLPWRKQASDRSVFCREAIGI